jgi:hypothetical protein
MWANAHGISATEDAMELRSGSFTFPRARGIELRVDQRSFNFTSPVRRAVAILAGTKFGFSPRDDHHLGKVVVRVSTAIDDDVVTVTGTFGVRDWSGDVDDDYEGNLQFVLLAELEALSIPSNLSITGVEQNQAIQFFRSTLDLATIQGDNSIGLIAGKNTVARVFVDTGTNPNRPTIASITGQFEIRPPGAAGFTPVSVLNGPIAPRADATIQRRNANDTLNFLIPGAFCRDDVDFRVRVFDAARPSDPGFSSGTVQGTLHFVETAPMRIRGVGVSWTGVTPAIPAATLAQLVSTLAFVVKGYPTSLVFVTGFETITDGGNYASTSGGGCGPGWGGLLTQLREMQGDSDDIYFGLLPAAVPSGASGCGGGDGRVAASRDVAAAGFILQTAAQEIAHAFGRDHVCGSPPLDSNYPAYDSFPTASIGEVGIDDQGNVQDPALTLDFLAQASCSTTRWVSPYTYDGLRSQFAPVGASPDARALMVVAAMPHEGESMRREHLFLNFRIHRGGQIDVRPSFHYESKLRGKTGRPTPYGVELRDAHDRPLEAQRILLTDPYRDLDSPGIDFFKQIHFDTDTARVVFTCGEPGACEQKELLVIDVPREPPKVEILEPQGHHELKGRVRVVWSGRCEGQPLRYMLRYSADGGQTFRAVAPSLSETEYVVDLDNLPGGDRCRFQVLATEGIRTGSALSEVFRVPRKTRRSTITSDSSKPEVQQGATLRLRGFAFSPDAGSADPRDLAWVSDRDGPLGIGPVLAVQNLSPGAHRISLHAPDGLGGTSIAVYQAQVVPAPVDFHTSKKHPKHTHKRQTPAKSSPR